MEILYFSLINQQYGRSLKTFQCKYSEQCLGGRTLRDLIKALDVFFFVFFSQGNECIHYSLQTVSGS